MSDLFGNRVKAQIEFDSKEQLDGTSEAFNTKAEAVAVEV